MNTTTEAQDLTGLPTLREAKQSEPFNAVASIAGKSTHLVRATRLEEPAQSKVFVRQRYLGQGRYENIFKDVRVEAGTVLYHWTVCGQGRYSESRSAHLRKDYRPAEELTCKKCLAYQAKHSA